MTRIRGFDGIRAIAAISVILTHTKVLSDWVQGGWISDGLKQSIDGGAGVQAFFVLSGFLITYLLWKEYDKNGRISLRNFYIRRAFRIFPLYFLVVGLMILLYLAGTHLASGRSLAFAAFYSYNFIPKSWYSGSLGSLWSLAVEEHFYLIWPFLFLFFCHRPKWIYTSLLSFIVVSFILAIELSHNTYLTHHFFIKRWSFIAGANISMGVVLATYIHHKGKAFFKPLAVGILSALLIFNATVLDNYFISQYLRGIGFTLFLGWLLANQEGWLAGFLELGPLSYLGKISYGIYMYQGFFLATGPYRSPGQTWPPHQNIGIYFVLIATPISYHFFEKPVMNLRRRFIRTTNQLDKGVCE